MVNLSRAKILVTGGSGFLGRHLAAKLAARGAGAGNVFSPPKGELDLLNREDCRRAVAGREVVIHLAANVGGIGYNQERPGELFYENLVMGAELMEAARREGVKKFVGIGTVCAYPKFAPAPFREDDLWNGYPEETNAPYGLSKKMLLVQAQAYRAQYGFDAVTLFPVNLYGPGDSFDPGRAHVIPALIRRIDEAMRSGKPEVEAWGSGKPTREFLYVEDAAEGILLAVERYDKPEPVNLGSGKEISVGALAELIAGLMGFKGSFRWDASKPDGQPRRLLDTSRAEREFGFRAATDLEEGLRRTIGWYRSQGRSGNTP